ncbi:MAG TPA: hypothetical protein VH593_28145, partial [Ktedonobacteraceae bacterium]
GYTGPIMQRFIEADPSQVIIICDTAEQAGYLQRHSLQLAIFRAGGITKNLGSGRYLLANGRQLIFTTVHADVNAVLAHALERSLVVAIYSREMVDEDKRERIEQQIAMLEQRRQVMVMRVEDMMPEIRAYIEAGKIVGDLDES